MIKFEQGDIEGFIKDFESFTRVARLNNLDGKWEIGYGHTGKFLGREITAGMVCSRREADIALSIRLSSYSNELERIGRSSQVYQRDAISSIWYNMGKDGCPKLIGCFISEKYDLAADQFMDGIYCNDKPVLGLLRRRISEYRMFTLGVYERFQEGDPITAEERFILLAMNAHNDEAVEMIKQLKVEG